MIDADDLVERFKSDQPHYNVAFVPDGLCLVSVLSCLLLSCSYVGSLYVWKSDLPRDHPAVIKRRFTSVLIVSALSPVFVWAWKDFTGIQPRRSLLALMGIRLEGLMPAVILPLLLTMCYAPNTLLGVHSDAVGIAHSDNNPHPPHIVN